MNSIASRRKEKRKGRCDSGEARKWLGFTDHSLKVYMRGGECRRCLVTRDISSIRTRWYSARDLGSSVGRLSRAIEAERLGDFVFGFLEGRDLGVGCGLLLGVCLVEVFGGGDVGCDSPFSASFWALRLLSALFISVELEAPSSSSPSPSSSSSVCCSFAAPKKPGGDSSISSSINSTPQDSFDSNCFISFLKPCSPGKIVRFPSRRVPSLMPFTIVSPAFDIRTVIVGKASRDQNTKKALAEFDTGVRSPYPIVVNAVNEK